MHIICILFLQPFELCRKKGKCTQTFCMLLWLSFVHDIEISQTYPAFFFQKFSDQKRMTIFFNFQIIMYTCIQKLLNVLY